MPENVSCFDPEKIGTLHIYEQPFHHAEAYILGNRVALELLRDAINEALDGKQAQAYVFQNDGEGYAVDVRCVAESWAQALPSSYRDYQGDWSEQERAAFSAALDGRAAS